MRNVPLSPDFSFLLFSFILRAVALFIFLSFHYVAYSIYVETMYCSYLSVCPVETTGNLIFYLVILLI